MLLNIQRDHSGQAKELRALFEKQLKELYWAEKTMAAQLTDSIDAAFSKDLAAALEQLRENSFIHVSRLEKLFDVMGIASEMQKYEALNCLMKEAQDFIMETRSGVVRDAGLIAVLQKIKHYEIACYGTMRAYAIALRDEDAVSLLEHTLEEEKAADLKLSSIAESHINTEAADKEY